MRKLILKDGAIFEGEGFGASTDSAGEVVFSTAMTGYVETLTDPSFFGQILVLTYPLIGNYGVPCKKYFQSKRIQVSGLVVTQWCPTPSHFQNQKNLDQWLKENNVPGISGIDTRFLTQKIRKKGVMLGKIIEKKDNLDFYDPNKENLVEKVSIKKPKFFGGGKNKETICLIDCGFKKAILECLLKRKINVLVAPWDFNPFKKSFCREISGLVVSNGPGDPQMAKKTIETVKEAIKKNLPILGICLGNQILALAAGAKTYKLKFGHRSLNQPVEDIFTKKCFITSQNHGFVVDIASLPENWELWFSNLNDGSCEGIISKNRLFMGVQFHPEGHPGPQDTEWIFDEFLKKVKDGGKVS